MLNKFSFQERLSNNFKICRFFCSEKGAALVETTLLLPVILALSAGVLEFSNLFYKKLLIEAGLRDAARYWARCPTIGGFSCSKTIAQNIAVYGSPGVGTPRVSGWLPGDVVVDDTTYSTPNPIVSGEPLFRGPANIITVHVSTTFTYSGTSLLNYIGIGNVTLNGAHEERFIGW